MRLSKLPRASSLDRSPEGIDSPANAYMAPSISGDAFAGNATPCRICGSYHNTSDHDHSYEPRPAFRMPHFKYTGPATVLMSVDVDMDAEVIIVGQPENGAYEWVVVNHGKVESHSDCGYGQKSIALRDGLIAYHDVPA